jgi:nitrogen regulatory protein PII
MSINHPQSAILNLMKQVIAVVKPYLVEEVLDALKLAPVEACGVCEVKGYGRQKSYLDEYRGSEYSLAYLPKVEITLWVDDLRVDEVVRTIVDVARTGRMGDGKIFILPVFGDGYEVVPQSRSGTAEARNNTSPGAGSRAGNVAGDYRHRGPDQAEGRR